MQGQQPSLEDLIDQYPGWHIRPSDTGRLYLATRHQQVDTRRTSLRMTIITDTSELLAMELDQERAREDQLRELAW